MKLIMTDAEKKTATWAELDDASLGKVVKASMFQLKRISEEQDKLLHMAAGMVLIDAAVNSNADTMIMTLEGLTVKGQSAGNWKITLQKQNKNKGEA